MGHVVVDTRDVVRVLETSHPPTYYLPRRAFTEGVLRPMEGTTVCEWRARPGTSTSWCPACRRWSPSAGGIPQPAPRYPELADRAALYAAPFDAITLDDEQVRPQPGGFYGGWVTAEVVGPFKGGPGSWGW
jgi:uncharacterized protein (DUF427 family)